MEKQILLLIKCLKKRSFDKLHRKGKAYHFSWESVIICFVVKVKNVMLRVSVIKHRCSLSCIINVTPLSDRTMCIFFYSWLSNHFEVWTPVGCPKTVCNFLFFLAI